MGRLDFEDMLGLALRLFDEHPEAVAAVRTRFWAFTVDEFQDVNLLQAGLLDRWLGDRDDLCVVGDDYQTIYAFTGASPEHLLGFMFPPRDGRATGGELPLHTGILELANRLAPRLGGISKTLRATRSSGPPPIARAQPDERAEVASVVEGVRRLAQEEAVPLEEIAVLYRIATPDRAVRGGVRRRRRSVPGARRCVPATPRASFGPSAAAAVPRGRVGGGDRRRDHARARLRPGGLSGLGRRDHAPIRSGAHAVSGVGVRAGAASWRCGGVRGRADNRFSTAESGRGVNLLTYHRAKGLEFDAVFSRGCSTASSRSGPAVPRPTRTRSDGCSTSVSRARRYLFLTWAAEGRSRPSSFLEEMGVSTSTPSSRASSRPTPVATAGGGPLFERLKDWRRKRAQADDVPAYVVFHDRTLAEIAERKPGDRTDLAAISGVGPAKLERYADEVLEIVGRS